MKNPPAWWKRIAWGLLLVAGTAFLAVALANSADYVRFHRAWSIGERLGVDGLREIGTACTEVENKGGPQRLSASELPAVFQSIGVKSATFYPGSSDLLLYERGDAYLFMRINSSRDNQRILLFTNSSGAQRQKILWIRNPEKIAMFEPRNRTVTIEEGSDDGRCVIVLPNEIRVFHRNNYVGGTDALLAVAPLSVAQRDMIAAAIAAVPASVRGREHTSGGLDGRSLRISFTSDGSRGLDDIFLKNAWREEVAPLVDAVSGCLPLGQNIDFKANLLRFSDLNAGPLTAWTWAQKDAMQPQPAVPWWCVWRRL